MYTSICKDTLIHTTGTDENFTNTYHSILHTTINQNLFCYIPTYLTMQKGRKKTTRRVTQLQEKESKDDKGDNNNINEVNGVATSNSNSDKGNDKDNNTKKVVDNDNKKVKDDNKKMVDNVNEKGDGQKQLNDNGN